MNKKFMVVALMAALSTVGFAADYTNEQIDNKVTDALQGALGYTDNVVTELEGKFNDKVTDALQGALGYTDNVVTDINNRLEGYEDVKENANSAIILGQENKAEIERVDKENKDQQAAIDKNTSDITTNRNDIEALQQNFAQYDGRLSGLEKKVDHLDDKMNKGLSLMAAMNAVDFQNVQTGEMALGAGIGHYGNAQSVALGVAYSPVEDLTVNAKYSVTAGDVDSFALGAGATYKFKIGR